MAEKSQGFAASLPGFELAVLELRLKRQVLRLRAAELLREDPFRGLYIADEQVDALLARGPATAHDLDGGSGARALTRQLAELEGMDRDAAESRPLRRLARLFELDAFELGVVIIALAPEIDQRYETLYAYVQNDATRKRPTAGLALDLLCDSHGERMARRRSLTPRGRLLSRRLLSLLGDSQDGRPTLLGHYLKLEDRVADFLLGGDALDAEIRPFTRLAGPARALREMPLPGELARRLARACQVLKEEPGVVLLQGPYGAGKEELAAACGDEIGLPLLAVEMARAPSEDEALRRCLALLRREARLREAGLLLLGFERSLTDDESRPARLARFAHAFESGPFPLFLASETPWEPQGLWGSRPFLSFALPPPDAPLRQRLWREAVGDSEPLSARDEDLADVAGKFVLSPGQIRDAGRRALHLARSRPGERDRVTALDLHAAARAQSSQGLEKLARKVETPFTWDDIVLPRRALRQLEEIYASVRHRARVYSEWGFEERLALGKGLNVLFAGPSGTGKTMAASILGRELGLDLYKIDLATVVSKYIGETEKNLSRVFDEAQATNAILFFDEADALFGKRSEVRDSHDRYANIEVAYLLQRMEEYEGVSILATNLKNNLDDAFARRLHHTVDFPFPDAAHRERIWRRIFPPTAPLGDNADLPWLARQFELAGGNIKNIALAAAFLAAEEATEIGMEALVLATARELQKLGKLPTKSEFGEYYEWIRMSRPGDRSHERAKST